MITDTTRLLNIAGGSLITVGASSTQSAAMDTTEIQISGTTNCWINAGTNPTAVAGTSGNMYFPAGTVMTIKWIPGNKLAAIQDSTGGFITVTPVGR